MQNKKRLFALILCLGMVLTWFVSSAYIVSYTDHDCIGQDCDICDHITEALALLHGFMLLVLPIALIYASSALRRHLSFIGRDRLSARRTLVGLKIRLNN